MNEIIKTEKGFAKLWNAEVEIEKEAREQIVNCTQMPFVSPYVAVMPDAHMGYGSTVGTVIPTYKAIIPAAVGVDIGCGMMALKTNVVASSLPDDLSKLRSLIEKNVPHGRTDSGREGDRGSWGDIPDDIHNIFLNQLNAKWEEIKYKHPDIQHKRPINQLGTLGTGNHFIEICLDEGNAVWIMLHSGSRGQGNRIGTYFIGKAKEEMEKWMIHLPDKDLAYLPEGSQYFDAYVEAVGWAQDYAKINRTIMMKRTLMALEDFMGRDVQGEDVAVNCHHNYVQKENHHGKNLWITRKGAVSAKDGEMGIIPGSMGAKSFIVRGKGNPESFHSCSHGAGRKMSRTKARNTFTIEEHEKATQGVECRKDKDVIDETPAAYKDIDAVMNSQVDLVDIVHTLKQIVCVKG